MPVRKPSDDVQVGLRIKERMRQRLIREAEKNQVSINREINDRIEQSFEAGAMRSIDDVAANLVNAYRKVTSA
jgi:hypothetical protein